MKRETFAENPVPESASAENRAEEMSVDEMVEALAGEYENLNEAQKFNKPFPHRRVKEALQSADHPREEYEKIKRNYASLLDEQAKGSEEVSQEAMIDFGVPEYRAQFTAEIEKIRGEIDAFGQMLAGHREHDLNEKQKGLLSEAMGLHSEARAKADEVLEQLSLVEDMADTEQLREQYDTIKNLDTELIDLTENLIDIKEKFQERVQSSVNTDTETVETEPAGAEDEEPAEGGETSEAESEGPVIGYENAQHEDSEVGVDDAAPYSDSVSGLEDNEPLEVVEGRGGEVLGESQQVEVPEGPYQVARREWHKSRTESKQAETDYHRLLNEYYRSTEAQSLLGRGYEHTKRLFRGLPKEVQEAEQRYRETRTNYARALEGVFNARSEVNTENKKFDSESSGTKQAFFRRFVTKQREKLHAVQRDELLTAQQKEKVTKIASVLKNHKNEIRVGAIALAGATGGVAAALVAGGNMMRSAFGGAAGAVSGGWAYDKVFGTKRIQTAQAQLQKTQNESSERFTVDNIDKIERALDKAEKTVDKRKREKKLAVIAGAMAGVGLANIDRILDAIDQADSVVGGSVQSDGEVMEEGAQPEGGVVKTSLDSGGISPSEDGDALPESEVDTEGPEGNVNDLKGGGGNAPKAPAESPDLPPMSEQPAVMKDAPSLSKAVDESSAFSMVDLDKAPNNPEVSTESPTSVQSPAPKSPAPPEAPSMPKQPAVMKETPDAPTFTDSANELPDFPVVDLDTPPNDSETLKALSGLQAALDGDKPPLSPQMGGAGDTLEQAAEDSGNGAREALKNELQTDIEPDTASSVTIEGGVAESVATPDGEVVIIDIETVSYQLASDVVGVDEDAVQTAIAEYLQANPPTVGKELDNEKILSAVNEQLATESNPRPVTELTLDGVEIEPVSADEVSGESNAAQFASNEVDASGADTVAREEPGPDTSAEGAEEESVASAQSPAPEVVELTLDEQLGYELLPEGSEYTWEKGDNFWDLMEAQTSGEQPNTLNQFSGQEQQALIDLVRDHLEADPDLAEKIGFRVAGDMDKVYEDESVDLHQLDAVAREVAIDNGFFANELSADELPPTESLRPVARPDNLQAGEESVPTTRPQARPDKLMNDYGDTSAPNSSAVEESLRPVARPENLQAGNERASIPPPPEHPDDLMTGIGGENVSGAATAEAAPAIESANMFVTEGGDIKSVLRNMFTERLQQMEVGKQILILQRMEEIINTQPESFGLTEAYVTEGIPPTTELNREPYSEIFNSISRIIGAETAGAAAADVAEAAESGPAPLEAAESIAPPSQEGDPGIAMEVEPRELTFEVSRGDITGSYYDTILAETNNKLTLEQRAVLTQKNPVWNLLNSSGGSLNFQALKAGVDVDSPEVLINGQIFEGREATQLVSLIEQIREIPDVQDSLSQLGVRYSLTDALEQLAQDEKIGFDLETRLFISPESGEPLVDTFSSRK